MACHSKFFSKSLILLGEIMAKKLDIRVKTLYNIYIFNNKEQEIIGAIGVVGPTRLNYSKIVPLVDYTSKIIGKVIK